MADHIQVHHLPSVDDVEIRATRALQSLVEARARYDQTLRPSTSCSLASAQEAGTDPITVISRTLQDALQTTAFGLNFEPGLAAQLLPHAEHALLPAGTTIELKGACDALYVVLSGSAEVLKGPSKEGRTMKVTVENARNLQGDSEIDRLDPYPVIKIGSKTYKGPVAMDAGPDPDFNWTQIIPYASEPEIEFLVMEYDDYSRHDYLGLASLSALEFQRNGYIGEINLCPHNKEGTGAAQAEGDAGISPPILRRSATAKHNMLLRDMGTVSVKIEWQGEEPGVRSGSAAAAEAAAQDQQALASTSETLAEEPVAADRTEEPWVTGTSDFEGPGRMVRASEAKLQSYGSQEKLGGDGTPMARDREGQLGDSRRPGQGRSARQSGDEHRGRRLAVGQFFGEAQGGGMFRVVEDSRLLVVPRERVAEAMGEYLLEQRKENNAFLRKHLPGAQALDTKTFETFAQMWSQEVYPRGHALCRAGSVVPPGERRVCIIKRGVCRTTLPPAARQSTTGPMRRVEQALKPSPTPVQLGLLGEGAVIGFGSAWLGVPEPYTAVPDEPVVVLWISVAERPVQSWPRDIVYRLQENLRVRTEWNGRRAQVLTSPVKTGHEAEDKWAPPEWKVGDSPFWKHKDQVSLWRAETMRDRFDAEGWQPSSPGLTTVRSSGSTVLPLSQHHLPPPPPKTAGSAVSSPHSTALGLAGSGRQTMQSWGSRSCPGSADLKRGTRNSTPMTTGLNTSGLNLTTLSSLQEMLHGPFGQTDLNKTADSHITINPNATTALTTLPTASSPGPASSASSPALLGGGCGKKGAPSQRGTYAVNQGLGRCNTPWGQWCPSGMLPLPSDKKRRVTHRDARHGLQNSMSSSSIGEREEVLRNTVNLRCPSEWRRMRSVACAGALEKMCKQQARTKAAAMGAFVSASGVSSGTSRPTGGPLYE